MRVDVDDHLEAAAEQSERLNGVGIIKVSVEVMDEMIMRGAVPVLITCSRVKPGVFEFVLRDAA